MSIQVSWDNVLDEPPDPLNVERPGASFSYAACYANWWGSGRYSPGRVRTAVSSGGRYKLYPGHLETLRNLVTWARSQGLDVRLTHSLGGFLGGRQYNTYPVYSLELQYIETDPADKIFYGLNQCRFATGEFVKGKLPTSASYRQLLTLVFQRSPDFYGHLPFTNPYGIIGGYGWGKKSAPDKYPDFGKYMGRGLYAFWSTFTNRNWQKTRITERYADRSSKISAGEWISFYQQWYKTDDKDRNY